MKLLIIATVWLCYTVAQACEIQVWRGHKIHCCTNGTAIKNASGGKVWVSQKPLICNESVNETANSETSVLSHNFCFYHSGQCPVLLVEFSCSKNPACDTTLL